MTKENIIIIYGGQSAEHNVSLLTAKSIINSINKNKYNVYPIFISNKGEWAKGDIITKNIEKSEELIFNNFNNEISSLLYINNQKADIVFPVIHGTNGEDGTLQGFLEILNIAYVGNNVLSSATGMDKAIMKKLFSVANLPQLPYLDFLIYDWKQNKNYVINNIEKTLNYPIFVKPANLGSSVGISRCTNKEELIKGIEEAFTFDRKIVVEQGIEDAKEIEVAVLGNNIIKTTDPGEIINISNLSAFYDYETKYTDGKSKMEIPANINKELYTIFKNMAKTAFKAIDACGLIRADFFLSKNEEIFINEVNTMPGFTPFSMFPSLWKNMGLSYEELIEELIKLGKEKYQEKNLLKTEC